MQTHPPLPGSKRDRTRDQILAAAQALLLDAKGGQPGISTIAARAGVVHGTFYNYFDDVPALLAEIEKLITAAHAASIAPLIAGVDDPSLRFARITRFALGAIAARPEIGRLMFDAGLPADGLSRGLRASLASDIEEGIARKIFRASNAALAASIVAGAIQGLAIDLYRGALARAAIDEAVASLLAFLGVPPARARKLATEKIALPVMPALPLGWLNITAASPASPKPGKRSRT
ncbi:MAG TPA: TetR/AcrR family transcriptional regulator [Micropepsaceae bacterium]|nr:TetR/AcrR family transcriptional regulator [Micropepsaceae bacterium]